MNIYIVYGRVEEPDRRVEWNVAAYWNEEMAKAHAAAAKDRADELFDDCENTDEGLLVDANPFDPDMYSDDWPVEIEYGYFTMPILEVFEENAGKS